MKSKQVLLLVGLLWILFLAACEVQQVQNQIIKEAQNTKITESITPIAWYYDYNWYDGYPKLKVEYQHDSLKYGEHQSVILNIVPITTDKVTISYRMLECDNLEGSSDLLGIRELCFHPLALKKAGLDDKDVYIIVRRSRNVYDFDEIEGKSIDELKKSNSITVYTQHIPPVDEKGFVPIAYVDETWCRYYASKQYPDECDKFIKQMKNPDCSLDKFEYVCEYLRGVELANLKEFLKSKQITNYDGCVKELDGEQEKYCLDIFD